MAITLQEVEQVLNDANVDVATFTGMVESLLAITTAIDPETLANFLTLSSLMVEKDRLAAVIRKKREDQSTANQTVENEVNALEAEREAIDKQIRDMNA